MIETTGDPPTVDLAQSDLSESDRHRLLSDVYRRAILETVSERLGPTELETLMTAVDARVDPEQAEHESERELEILLHHKHLPVMASMGLFDYDHERHRIVP